MEQAEEDGKRKVQTETDAETAEENKALEVTEQVKGPGTTERQSKSRWRLVSKRVNGISSPK